MHPAAARVGALIGNTLPYVTGGLALGDIYAYDVTGASGSSFRAGWTIGGGIEQRFEGTWSAWSVKIEYLYADFGSASYFTLPGHTPENVNLTATIFRLGIN